MQIVISSIAGITGALFIRRVQQDTNSNIDNTWNQQRNERSPTKVNQMHVVQQDIIGLEGGCYRPDKRYCYSKGKSSLE